MPPRRPSKASTPPTRRTTSPATASSSSAPPPRNRSSQRGGAEGFQSRRSVRFDDAVVKAIVAVAVQPGKRLAKQTAKKAASTEAIRKRIAQAQRRQQLQDRQRLDNEEHERQSAIARRALGIGLYKVDTDEAAYEAAYAGEVSEVEREIVQAGERQQM